MLTLFIKFSCSLSLQIPPTYSISTFSLKYKLILTHNFSSVNIYLINILIMVAFLIVVFITLYFLSVSFSIHFPHFINHYYFQKYSFPAYYTPLHRKVYECKAAGIFFLPSSAAALLPLITVSSVR